MSKLFGRSLSISGPARSGKDTVADVLVSLFGYERASFAGPLKALAAEAFGWDGEKDERGRRLLQVLGTEAGRAYDESIWVRKLVAQLKETHTNPGLNVVVTDTRFPNEAEALRGLGFVLLRVERPALGLDRKAPSFWRRALDRLLRRGPDAGWRAHPSEVALDGYPFDFVFVNAGSLEDLRREVEAFWLFTLAREASVSAYAAGRIDAHIDRLVHTAVHSNIRRLQPDRPPLVERSRITASHEEVPHASEFDSSDGDEPEPCGRARRGA